MNKFKILFCGLGAIGQRHLRIIKKNYNKKFEFYYFKETNKEFLINDDLTINKEIKSLSNYYKIKRIEFKELENYKFDIVFITNTPSKHIKYALKFSKKNSYIFIEKPLSTNLKDLNKLKALQIKNNTNIHVGYNFRFHPLIKKVNEIVNKKSLGKIINTTSYFGEYIPFAHKYEDYKKSHYTNKRDGGATLGFCHNINLILLFHKKIKKILFKKLENQFLNLDCEEISIAIMRGVNNELITMQNNFYNYEKKYFFLINFEKGSLKLDLTENFLEIGNHSKKKIRKIKLKNFYRNKMFEDEIKFFMVKFLNKNKISPASLIEAIETQKIISKIRD